MKRLRIFYAAPNSPNSQFKSNLWRKNLRDSLSDAGHQVIDFDFDLEETFQHLDPGKTSNAEFIAKNRPKLSQALLEQIRVAQKEKPVDLFFSYFYSACLESAIIEEIRRSGIITLNWYCNASYQFHLVREIAPSYDWCLVAEKVSMRAYEEVGARPIYCPEAANPAVYKPMNLTELYDVSFVGQAYGERPGLVRWLRDERIDVRVWGPLWEYYRWRRPSLNPLRWGKTNSSIRFPARIIGGVLSDQALVETIQSTKINLGFAACAVDEKTQSRVTQIRLRDFEIPMSGAFYLTEYLPELEEFFEIDQEIACYRSKEELRDKIRFFLRHPDERKKIREAGRRRCLADHTWAKRFESVFRRVGLI